MVSANNSKEHASVYHSVPETGIVGGVDGMNLTQQKQQMVEMGDVEHQQQHSEKSSPFLTNDFRATLISACYMSLAAMLGCLLRIACAQLFGEECKNPGTVGWLASDSPLCVTVDGGNSEIGGIVFADFPANMLGSFIMGLMLAGDKLLLPLNLPIPWLRADNSLQQWDVIHLAIRTGFCGSLTTFSSWNSDMVTMMFSQAGQSHSQVVRAIIGYIIGLETALGSFVFGSKVATMVHRYVNPVLAEEADAILERREQGVYINAKLPEFERRFLPDLTMNNIMHNMESLQQNPEALGNLERWRFSTREARRVGHDLLPALVEIENCILIERQSISSELEEIARNVGWNLAALDEWSRCRRIHAVMIGSSTWESDQGFTLKHAAAILFAVYVSLFLGLVLCNGDDSYSVTYRTMLYAAILAPPEHCFVGD